MEAFFQKHGRARVRMYVLEENIQEVSEFLAYLNKSTFIENFRFTKTKDILFSLGMNSKLVYNLLFEMVNEKKYAKALYSTSLIEVLPTVI